MRSKDIKEFLKNNPRKQIRKFVGDNSLTTKDEYWIDMKGYEGVYIISTKGRFKQYERKLTLDGEVIVIKNTDVKLIVVKNERYHGGMYTAVRLSGQLRPIKMLMAMNFMENPLDYRYITNIDKNPLNNSLDNLEYSDLCEIRYDEVKVIQGSKNYQAKLTEEDVIDILKKFNEGMRYKKIQEIYPIHTQNLYRIKKGLIWRHITSPKARVELKI